MSDKKSGDDFTAGIIAAPIVAAFVVIIPMALVLPKAAVLALLWRWYAVPALAVPAIGLWAAFGLVLIGQLLTLRKAAKDDDGFWTFFKKQLLAIGLILLLGWIGSFFV